MQHTISEQRLRVLHIITGLHDGGAEAVLYRLCCADPHDQHVVIGLVGSGKYEQLLHKIGVPVYCLNMPRSRLTVSGILRLSRLIERYCPDIIQTWMYHANLVGGLIAYYLGYTTVWGIHHASLNRDSVSFITLWTAKVGGWLSHAIPYRIIMCAKRATLTHAQIGYDPDRMIVIPNGYDLQRFQVNAQGRVQLRAELQLAHDAPVLGCVARWDPCKDHVNLLTAFASVAQEIHDVVLILVGTGMTAENAELLQLIDKLHIPLDRLRFLGRRDDIPLIMNALDLHILSSHTEAFPNVLAEAMACGTPCISTDVGDAAQIIGDTGWIVPPRQPVALAEAIRSAIQEWHDRGRWQHRQAAARQRIVDHYTIDRMVARYRSVWLEALRCVA